MDIATESEQVPEYPLDVSMVAFVDIAKILSVLGNEDALAIFIYTKNGINSSKDAIRTLGLTQKRFYSRLKDLIDNRLIEKYEGEYRHTALGDILLEMGLSMEKLILSKEQLKVLDSIRKSGKFSESKTNQIAKALSIELPIFKDSGKVKMLDAYSSLIEEILELINASEKYVYLVSKYTDARVVNALLRAKNKGIEMRFLGEKPAIKDSLNALKIMLSPQNMKAFLTFSSEFKTILRLTPSLLFSFIVIDDRYTIVEIPNPTKANPPNIEEAFYLAFYFENEKVSKKIARIFFDMWEQADEFRIL